MIPFGEFWQGALRVTFLGNYFEFESVIQEETPFIDISNLELWWPSCSAKQNIWVIVAEDIMRRIPAKLF